MKKSDAAFAALHQCQGFLGLTFVWVTSCSLDSSCRGTKRPHSAVDEFGGVDILVNNAAHQATFKVSVM
ncbi:MAG TPA: hypothetical protein VGG79_11620 [Roseiarcus sp.]|jgi:NAD(P)-dependent dehydrogenase (short-subunit alcohol dehydrogenase family)